MRGHPDLDGVHKVADEIREAVMLQHGVTIPPPIRLMLYELIAQALLDEREACARTVELCAPDSTRWELANAIRAR